LGEPKLIIPKTPYHTMAEFKISGFCKNSNIAIVHCAFHVADQSISGGNNTSGPQAIILLEIKRIAPLPDHPNYQL
jgi:hypothetical protein